MAILRRNVAHFFLINFSNKFYNNSSFTPVSSSKDKTFISALERFNDNTY